MTGKSKESNETPGSKGSNPPGRERKAASPATSHDSCPLPTPSPLTYNHYLKVKELKELQICMSQPPHHDEPLFIIIHQTYELWFKLVLHEIDLVMELLSKNKVRRATHFLRRVGQILKQLVGQIHILETMAPRDFLGFRNKLNPASGFQSSQFREIEIACGMRDAMLLANFQKDAVAYPELLRRYRGPSLQDAFYDLLRRRGFHLPEPPKEPEPAIPDLSCEPASSLAPSPASSGCPMASGPKSLLSNLGKSLQPQSEEERLAAQLETVRLQELRKLYEQTEEYGELHDLAEALLDVDEQISLWRTHHVTVVERVIGFKRGTGGSEGVAYLRTTLHKRCFPDLWRVRTVLECPPEE